MPRREEIQMGDLESEGGGGELAAGGEKFSAWSTVGRSHNFRGGFFSRPRGSIAARPGFRRNVRPMPFMHFYKGKRRFIIASVSQRWQDLFMKLHCPDCGQLIAAEDINLSTRLAKCRHCNAVFGFGDSLETENRRAPEIKPILPKSKRLKVEDFAGVLRIHWRWFSAGFIFLAFFCVAWDSFLIFWYSMALTMKHVPWLMVVFPVAHVAVGIGLTYAVLAGFLNSTTVEVGQNELSIRHFPLPWSGNRVLSAGEIKQIHCEQKISRNNNSTSMAYSLYATLQSGVKLQLASGFTDPGEPKMIERLIEERLGIKDVRVVGEYRG
jgi:hypothetical protein